MNKIIFLIILIQLVVVAWIDVKTKLISNYWFVFNLLLFLCIWITSDLLVSWQNFYFPIGVIGFGFVFYLLKIMGAGDSKYLASLFLLIPYSFHWLFFEVIIQVTMLMGSVFLTLKLLRDFQEFKAYFLTRYWSALRSKIKSEFSFAPVILFSWILLGWKIWRS